MSFIRDLAKKLAGQEPWDWSVDKYTRSGKGDDQGDTIEVQITYRLTDEQIDMLHIIDEGDETLAGAGQ